MSRKVFRFLRVLSFLACFSFVFIPIVEGYPSIVIDPAEINLTLYSDENYTAYINILNNGVDTTDNGTVYSGTAYNLTFTSFPGGNFNPLFIPELEGNGTNVVARLDYQPGDIRQHGSFLYGGQLSLDFLKYSGNYTYVKTNKSLYKNLTFEVDISLRETTVEAVPIEVNFKIPYDDSAESGVTIVNTGDYIAYNVSYTLSDATFEDNTMDLEKGDSVLVEFELECPSVVDKTEETNKTYYRELVVNGENFPESVFNISIFVPYEVIEEEDDADNETIDYDEFWDELDEYCRTFPASPFCITEQEIVYRNITVEVEKPHRINMSDEEMVVLVESIDLQRAHISTIQQDISKIETDTSDKYDRLGDAMLQLSGLVNYTIDLAETTREDMIKKDREEKQEIIEKQKEEEESAERALLNNILIFFAIFVGVMFLSVIVMIFYNKAKNIALRRTQ